MLLKAAAAGNSDPMQPKAARDILGQLRKLLIRNKTLQAMLGEKIAKVEQTQQWTFHFSPDDSAEPLDLETQKQLQPHGFDFSHPLPARTSPHSESAVSDVSYHPSVPNESQANQVANRSPLQHPSEKWAQQRQWTQSSLGQNVVWESPLQPNLGSGYSVSQDLFNQLQGFHQELDEFGMDMPLESDDFHRGGWADGSSDANPLTHGLPVTAWERNYNAHFNR